jgi:hypothetical protein
MQDSYNPFSFIPKSDVAFEIVESNSLMIHPKFNDNFKMLERIKKIKVLRIVLRTPMKIADA